MDRLPTEEDGARNHENLRGSFWKIKTQSSFFSNFFAKNRHDLCHMRDNYEVAVKNQLFAYRIYQEEIDIQWFGLNFILTYAYLEENNIYV